MKNRPVTWSGDAPVLNWKRNFVQTNPRTHVPRFIRPIRACRYTHRFHSSVDIDAKKLRNCCGKWKVNNELYVYIHRIVDIGKETKP